MLEQKPKKKKTTKTVWERKRTRLLAGNCPLIQLSDMVFS